MTPKDAWVDATLCPLCGRDSCEEHLPGDDPPTPTNDCDHDAEARAARRAIKLADELERQRILREVRRQLDADERPRVTVPLFEALRDRLARPVVETPWRIQGWQPSQSRVMLAAQFKAGKTTLRDNYIRSLVDGDSFLGAAVTPITGTLVVIDTEMSASQSDAWMKAQGIRHDDRVIPVLLRGQAAQFNLLDEVLRAEWGARLREAQAENLILDCLRPVLDALGLDEHHEAGRFLVAFDALLREAKIPEALIIQHMGHANERARGDSRLRDWPDVEWRLVRGDENPASPRFITAYGRDVDVPESQLVYDTRTRHLTLIDGSRKDAKIRAALDAVVEVLCQATGLSGLAIKRALQGTGHSRDTIDAALRFGVKRGELSSEPGTKNAILYRVSVERPNVRQCPDGVSGHSSGVSVRVSGRLSKADTPDTPVLPLDGNHSANENARRPDTQTRKRPRRAGTRNTASTRHRAADEP